MLLSDLSCVVKKVGLIHNYANMSIIFLLKILVDTNVTALSGKPDDPFLTAK